MSRRLPPLNALRAFEAAARHVSFARAAEELNVTPGAVSQQIKALETHLGLRLFRRLPRGLALTTIAERYTRRVAEALDLIDAATAETVEPDGARRLAISALPAFAEKWLVPRLGRFRDGHPAIEIALAADEAIVDLGAGAADLALRYGQGGSGGVFRGLSAERLFDDEIFPVCSPTLLTGPYPLTGPWDLAAHTLLHDVPWSGDWRAWLTAAGIDGIDAGRGPSFTLYSMAVDAAVKGIGVLIGHRVLVAEELADGRLVAPFDLRLPLPKGFYLVSTEAAAARPSVQSFRDWLLEEVASAGS